jgi:hypothetical protein
LKTAAAIALTLLLHVHASAQDRPPPPPAEELPPPPLPDDEAPQPRPPAAVAAPGSPTARPKRHQDPPGVIGEAPLAPAGSMGAPVQPDERFGNWSYALGSGVGVRSGGYQPPANSSVLLYFGGQADGLWTEGTARAARVRLRLLTGGDGMLLAPSEGEVEGAYMIGRREFRFVLARLEAGRYPGLAVQTLVQAATIPSVEGVLASASDKVRVFYNVSPVEAAYVWYVNGAHITHSPTATNENASVEAATAVRLRATFLVPPAVLISVEGDYLRMWGPGDQYKAVEGSAGFALLDKTVLLDLMVRWESYTRRSNDASLPPGSMVSSDQLLAVISATLVL